MDILAPFSVSPRAAQRISEIAAGEPATPALRVEVLAGGCSGFQYRFGLIDAPRGDDVVIKQGDAVVVVDTASLDFLAGAELDFKDALMGAHFVVQNPNATSSCGCGTSFSVE